VTPPGLPGPIRTTAKGNEALWNGVVAWRRCEQLEVMIEE